MTSRRNFLKQMGLATAGLIIGCTKDENETTSPSIDVEFDLPSLIVTTLGGTYTFTVLNGKAPLETDSFVLTNSSGVSYTCSIIEVSSASFTVQFTASCVTGDYTVSIKRDSNRKSYGSTYLSVSDAIEGLELKDDTTSYGLVSCAGEPLEGVLVSDGVDFALTDEKGVYQLASKKERGYVFISVPSGYEVGSDGVLPMIWYNFRGDSKTVERADFPLTKKNGQNTFKFLLFGDMHLAKRTNDLKQFQDFTDDLNEYLTAHKGETIYGMTLGDMSWDLYWYSNGYSLPDYLDTINGAVKGLQIFHTMGNHDNDYLALNDYDAEIQYIENIGPTYYSFNLGKIHIVVLDDIDCSDYDGTTSRNYSKDFTTAQLDWLRRDLSYVDKSTPLIIFTHAQIFYPNSSGSFSYDASSTRQSNSNSFLSVIQDYTAHIVTGHTHLVFNVIPSDSITSGRNIYEHNIGAICASWWWSGHLTTGCHLCQDGSPGGYMVWDIDGTDIKYQFKATGHDVDFQFRTYDLNNVAFSFADVPNMNASNTTLYNAWNNYVTAYPGSSDNEVLINIFNWNNNWKLEVVDDNGKTLTPTLMWTYDPLHIAALSLKRLNDSSISSVPQFTTVKWSHMFKVKADDATVGLNITVTDDFGNVYTEHMERPKEFSTDAYAGK